MDFLFIYSDTLLPFFVLLLQIFSSRKLPNGDFLLRLYLLLTTIIMGFSNYLADRAIRNYYLYHLYSLFEVILLIQLITRFTLSDKKSGFVAIGLYALFWLINIRYLEPLSDFNSISSTVAALFISFFCFRYFLLISRKEAFLYFKKIPSFWIVSGILFYCIASVFVSGTYRFVPELENINSHTIWIFQQNLNIIKFILISIGILCCYRPTSPHG